MSPRDPHVAEPERYELHSPSIHHFEPGRRDFFKLLGAGMAIFSVAGGAEAGQETTNARRATGEEPPKEISSWLHIGEDGLVTVFTGKVEIGQNIRTSLAQSVADELRVPFESVRMVMADTALTPFDRGTFGSRTTPYMTPQLRRAASAARDLLLAEAAKQWNAPADKLTAAGGKVTDPRSGRSLSYAELVAKKNLSEDIPAADPVTPPAQWTVAGKPRRKVNARDMVTGRHSYTTDLRPAGLLHGKVLRPPSFGATLSAVDLAPAQAMPGVTVVRDGDFIAAAAATEHAAERALQALKPEWKITPQPGAAEIFSYLKNNTEKGEENRETQESGSVAEGLERATHRLSATYTVAYIAHAPLEPRAAVAQWKGEELTVWTGSQRPFGVREELAETFRLPKERIRVIVPDTGSAYGGKHTGDAAIEAARLARAAGHPVKVVWSREEEFTWAYFRPAGVMEVKSGITGDGTLTAWEFHNYNSGGSGIETPYVVPGRRIQFHPSRSPLRQGSYRGLAATANHFARESHMDELAHAAGLDPLAFRMKNLSDPRLRAVLEAAAKSFGWPRRKKDPGQGFGIAGGVEKGGYVATCVELVAGKNAEDVRITRITTAFECGAIVNPDGLTNQIVGSNIMGLGGALFEGIDFQDGRITNPHFSRYRVPRFRDIPVIETVLLDRKDLASAGAGETPIVGLAPAVAGAIFDATGLRLRSLPLLPARAAT